MKKVFEDKLEQIQKVIEDSAAIAIAESKAFTAIVRRLLPLVCGEFTMMVTCTSFGKCMTHELMAVPPP